MSDMNDLDESTRSFYFKHIEDGIIDRCEQELQSYKQISLTSDGCPKDEKARRGFDIQTMWGLYADKGKGICLVFNKERLLAVFNKLPGIKKSGYVNYSNDYDSAIEFMSDSPEEEIGQRLDEIFFCKSNLWQNEQEYRLIIKHTGSACSLDISECIEGIIFATLGAKIDENPNNTKSYYLLERVCSGIRIFGYNHRSLNGNRTLYRVYDGKEVWSTGEIIDILSGEWNVAIM